MYQSSATAQLAAVMKNALNAKSGGKVKSSEQQLLLHVTFEVKIMLKNVL